MLGTMINVGSIVAGSLMGVAVGSRLPERVRHIVLNGLGLLTLLVGLQMALGTQNVMIVLGSILLGGVLGESLGLHDGLERLGAFLQSVLAKGRNPLFGEGFVTASLVFASVPWPFSVRFRTAWPGTIVSWLSSRSSTVSPPSPSQPVWVGSVPLGLEHSPLPGRHNPLCRHVGQNTHRTHDCGNDRHRRTAHCGHQPQAPGPERCPAGQFLPALVIAPLIVALLTLFS